MHPKRRQRLTIIAFVVLCCAAALALILSALQQNINLFFTPTQVHAGEAPVERTMRIGGMVVDGSLIKGSGVKVTFSLTDFNHSVRVEYEGLLPDLFREGQGIVARGVLNQDNNFLAEEVLAKHDETYMPPELDGVLPPEK